MKLLVLSSIFIVGAALSYAACSRIWGKKEIGPLYTIEEAQPELDEDDNPFPEIHMDGVGLTCQLISPWGQMFSISFDPIEWQMISTIAAMADEDVSEVVVDLLSERSESFDEEGY